VVARRALAGRPLVRPVVPRLAVHAPVGPAQARRLVRGRVVRPAQVRRLGVREPVRRAALLPRRVEAAAVARRCR
jgi:hypothetical protein